MKTRSIFLVLILLGTLSLACSLDVNIKVDQGSGNVITESRAVSGFDRVLLSGIGDVQIVQGDQEALLIEAEDNIVPEITTEVVDGVLEIGFARKNIVPTRPVRFTLSMRSVHGLETKGVSNIEADQLTTDRLDVSISGTGNVDIDSLTADRLNVNVSGAGNFQAEGVVNTQKVTLSGAGNFSGRQLQSSSADVTITGLGRVVVWATSALDVVISGTGSVDYYGNPQVSQQISGLGKLNHMGDQ